MALFAIHRLICRELHTSLRFAYKDKKNVLGYE